MYKYFIKKLFRCRVGGGLRKGSTTVLVADCSNVREEYGSWESYLYSDGLISRNMLASIGTVTMEQTNIGFFLCFYHSLQTWEALTFRLPSPSAKSILMMLLTSSSLVPRERGPPSWSTLSTVRASLPSKPPAIHRTTQPTGTSISPGSTEKLQRKDERLEVVGRRRNFEKVMTLFLYFGLGRCRGLGCPTLH